MSKTGESPRSLAGEFGVSPSETLRERSSEFGVWSSEFGVSPSEMLRERSSEFGISSVEMLREGKVWGFSFGDATRTGFGFGGFSCGDATGTGF
jgi:hypothetical protein